MKDPNYKAAWNMIDCLKKDLSIRENNAHYGTNLGGDPYLFNLLISSKLEVEISNTIVVEQKSPDTVFLSFPEVYPVDWKNKKLISTLISLRESLIKLNIDRKQPLSFKDFFNSEWVNNQKIVTPDWLLLKVALKESNELLLSLKESDIICNQISEHFNKKEAIILDYFFKEYPSLLDSNNEADKYEESDSEIYEFLDSKLYLLRKNERSIQKIIDEHPIYGVILKELYDHRRIMFNNILLSEDLNRIKIINSMPDYIKCLAARAISIEYIVKYNLDEYLIGDV